MTPVWIALIAYLLFYLIKMKVRNELLSCTNLILVKKAMLFQRISLYEWLANPDPPKPKPVQVSWDVLEFAW
jgi:hypothetical protein